MPSFLPRMPKAYFPRADAAAGSMMTPGGVMAGLTDLTRAVTEAPIQRQEMEASRENAQFERQYKMDNMKFMQGREQADAQQFATREANENQRHSATLENQRKVAEIGAGARMYGADQSLKGTQTRAAAKGTSLTPGISPEQARAYRFAEREANIELYGDEDGPSNSIPVVDEFGRPLKGPDGQPAYRRAPRDLTPEERTVFQRRRDEIANKFLPPPPQQPQHQPENDPSGAPPAQAQAGSTSMTPQPAPAQAGAAQGAVMTRAELQQMIETNPDYGGYTVDELAAWYQTQGVAVQ